MRNKRVRSFQKGEIIGSMTSSFPETLKQRPGTFMIKPIWAKLDVLIDCKKEGIHVHVLFKWLRAQRGLQVVNEQGESAMLLLKKFTLCVFPSF
jgi:hypothetical protein